MFHGQRVLALGACLLLLNGCGGGGGGGNNGGGGTPPLTAQTIAFSDGGPINRTFGDAPFSNAASGGAGSGAITYGSANDAVATVTSTGEVTLRSAGTVQITATKAADSAYAMAQTSYTLNIAKAARSIAFAESGPIDKRTGDAPFTNAASDVRGGPLTYASSNVNVATVEPTTGEVTIVAAGTADITASATTDDRYLPGQATYTLNITAVRRVAFIAQVGPTDSIVTFAAGASGADFLRSTDTSPPCDPLYILVCANGQQDTIGAGPITDTVFTLSRGGSYWLRDGTSVSPLAPVGSPQFYVPQNHRLVAHDGRLWRIGGELAFYPNWSRNGMRWTTTSSFGIFGTREYAGAVSFNGKLWVIGGHGRSIGASGPSVPLNDVWSSTDGDTWVRETAAAPFAARYQHEVVVHNGRIWVIGGRASDRLRDIWSSDDGLNWTQVAATAGFDDRLYYRAVSFNGRLRIIGGIPYDTADTRYSWSSTDGVTWTRGNLPAPWAPRDHHQVAVLNGKLWLSAGAAQGFNHTNDVWSSTDGENWTRVAQGTSFKGRSSHSMAALDGQLWILGGDSYAGGVLNDVWSSTDGVTWRYRSNRSQFRPIVQQRALELNGRYWLIGSVEHEPSMPSQSTEVWSTLDGDDWRLDTAAAPMPARSLYATATFDNRLWIAAGETEFGVYTNDVWSSTDGVTWIQATASGAFGARTNSQLIGFQGRLWLIGGGSTALSQEIWSSSDGASWTRDVAAAPFGPRTNHRVVEFNNELWLSGGGDSSGVANDVWRSSDGINWTQASIGFGAGQRMGPQMLVANGRLWIIGGRIGITDMNDVWSSADGSSWTQEAASTAFAGSFGASGAAIGGRLFIIQDTIWSSQNGIDWRRRHQDEFELR
ncbi:MAG TPA: Ig-like domain-containing protein [Steroidobacter sp.]